ncbi:MAG: hypothetical protein VB118_05085 [Oscillospiraceae bacterium]|nr:hypothetical protein [Oscillospiraceae bacterium]
MRLTNKLISGNYVKMLNNSLSDLNEVSEKVSAERKFLSISEDPATAIRAFRIRDSLAQNEVYKNNLSDVQGLLDEAESTISIINDVTTEAVAQVLQGITGTSDPSARKTVANALRSFQTTIMSAANAKYSDDYMFGGEATDAMPFTLGVGGALLYRGQDVDTATFSKEYKFIDIGIGLKIDGSGVVSPDSAMNIAFSGAEILGTGVDANGITNNLYNLLGNIANKLESGDLSNIKQYSDKLNDIADNVRLNYVSIGEKSNFVTYFNDRLANRKLTDSKKQNELEVLTLDEGALMYSERELVYNACLQMGTKILQPSLLDYLR